MDLRKLPTQSEIREWLRQGSLKLPPARFVFRSMQPKSSTNPGWDFEVEAQWDDQTAVFAVTCKLLSTPMAFEQALNLCQAGVLRRIPGNRLPLIMLPYLRPEQLEKLEQAGISGVDWCGNGIMIVPGRFRVYRSGAPNRFASYSPIKNIYRKNTSLVARVLLATSRFTSIGEVLAEINRRDLLAEARGEAHVAMGTVSKALKRLEDELIIEREPELRLLQADKLLGELLQNYDPPKARPIRLKVECDFDRLPRLLSTKIETKSEPLVATGLSSVARFATMQREDIISLYCPDAERIVSLLGGRETERFPNVEIIETTERPFYFDARLDEGFLWASPVQTWLELMRGDKRDRDTADQVKDRILRGIQGSVSWT